jgi:nitrate reductase gamma subunit
MIFDIALYAALVIFGIGLIHKIDTWFLLNVGTGERSIPVSQRFAAGAKGILASIFSAKLITILKVFFVDVLFQVRILKDKKDFLGWIMHLCLFWGFLLLLIFHALDKYIATAISPGYQSTLNPWMFLINLFGLVLLLGIVLAIVRRAVTRREDIKTSGMDIYAIAILLVIVCSGFLLDGLKITSLGEFNAMVEDYGDPEDVEATKALEALWVTEYGLVSSRVSLPVPEAVLDAGREANVDSCIDCHTRPQAAFVSYPLSRIIKPAAEGMDRAGFRTLLWYVHILSCFFGLAYLAFSKMFHIISTPISLIVAELSGKEESPAAAATRQMIELDGCSHGGACHETCPVRQRRIERIENQQAYEPMYIFLKNKTARELGSREVE